MATAFRNRHLDLCRQRQVHQQSHATSLFENMVSWLYATLIICGVLSLCYLMYQMFLKELAG